MSRNWTISGLYSSCGPMLRCECEIAPNKQEGLASMNEQDKRNIDVVRRFYTREEELAAPDIV